MAIQTPIVKINNYPNVNGAGLSGANISAGVKNNYNNSPTFGAWPEIKGSKLLRKFKWVGDDFSSAAQRFVSGFTAIFTQPLFDWNNKRTDEKTRKVSCARTLGKIIAGVLTGVSIRWGFIKLTEIFCQTRSTEAERLHKIKIKARLKKIPFTEELKTPTGYKQWLVPKGSMSATFSEIKKYRNAMGTFAAVLVMIATNFYIDVPLTTYFTNKFSKIFLRKDTEKAEQNKMQGGN